MTQPYRVSHNYRITLDEEVQYTLQHLKVVKGTEGWNPISYHTTVKALIREVRDRIGNRAAEKAKLEAMVGFDGSKEAKFLATLGDKKRRKRHE